ncbi:DUF6352 family protein [Limibacillus halophilus]|uniref:Uncharacterized protein n=1 Tax=Limibacillus halophilus TaxID=1579333 RepID=A0A839SVV1_9PROT|nr:DUF6352 family protein [Limibacillus halophilus]MBB3065073.1 hypothetical protein [Limibacillus halophilus]
MTDFWRDCGFVLLEREENGFLRVTDDFLRAYFKRPEIRPVEESCAAERKLHDALLRNPRQAVSDKQLTDLADPDARENYQIVLAFRDRLVAAGTVEGCYLNLFRDASGSAEGIPVPPLFVDQMTHVILRNILDGVADPLRARAGEFFFRPQKVTINDGHIMAADEEIVEMYASSGGFGSLGQLLVEAQTPLRTIDLDVLTVENAEMYWLRDQKYDTVLNLNFSGDGLDALCRVLESWVQHFLDVAVSIQPVQQITDERWVWHIGLEQEGTRLLNDLYQGVDVGEARLARLLSLFRLDFADPQEMRPDIAGRPVYLALSTNEQGIVRLKPQNLLVNLPLAAKAS